MMNRRILHERTYRGSMLQPEIDLRSTENARKRQNGKLSAWGSHLGHWGELRRRGLISGRGELELGLPGTATTGDVERWPRLSEVRGADDVMQLRPPTPSNACEGRLRSQRNSQGGQKAKGGAELRQEPHSLAKGLSENTGGGASRG